MKIIIKKIYNNYCYYGGANEWFYIQEQYDYIFKHLDFDKISKKWYIGFNNAKTEEWFNKTYKSSDWLKNIYNQSPEGYKWLKDNWGNGIYKLLIEYQDKQELKTIVNKIINVELKK